MGGDRRSTEGAVFARREAAGPASPAVGRRERKKLAVRRSIIDAAETLISEQSLEPTTVDQIATLADVSQTTFFNYFPTKTAVVDTLIAELVALFEGILQRAQGTDAPVESAVHMLFRASAELTEVQHRLLRDLIAETIRTSTPDARRSLERMRQVFTESLATGQRTGEVRDDHTAPFLADAVLGLYIAVFLFWTTDADYPVAERLRASIPIVMDLIAPRPMRTNLTTARRPGMALIDRNEAAPPSRRQDKANTPHERGHAQCRELGR